jgi:hypothetical protein
MNNECMYLNPKLLELKHSLNPAGVSQVRDSVRHLALEAQAEATAKGQRAAALRASSKVRGW